ncbi:MAG: tetratricopeptide repeat protein [Bacteroidales bacterium]|jgi:tetratricopeptide (TPR) repeat protein/DNA-binding CsgD family transcriptional regulator|nr:tetratricopeptide repeat protein [Bacteroidales bacterium]
MRSFVHAWVWISFLFFISSCSHSGREMVSSKDGSILHLADSLSHCDPAKADSLYLSILRDSSTASLSQQFGALLGESRICSGRSKYDTAAVLIRKAGSMALSAGDSSLLMKALETEGNLNIDLGDNKKAAECYEQGLAIARKTGKKKEQNNFILGLGSIRQSEGNYPEAVRIFTEASKLAAESKNFENQALALENIGLTLTFTSDNREAIRYIRQALEIRKNHNLLREYAMGLQNLGITYRKLDLLDSALICYRQAQEILTGLHDSNTLVRVRYNTGLVLKNQKKYREARQAMEEVLALCRRKGISDGEVYALHTLAAITDEEGKTHDGLKYSDSAITLAKKRGFISDLPLLLERKQDLLAKTGNYKVAYATALKSRELSDSLLSLDKQKEIALLKTRFDTERKESENILLKKNLQYQHSRLIFMAGILVLSALAFVFIVLMLIYRYKHLKQLKLLAEEKAFREEQEKRNKELELEKAKLEASLQETRISDLEYQSKLKEQELVFQSLIRTDLTTVNRSVHEKLFPFNLRFQRKKDQEEFIQSLDDITREASRDPLSEFELTFQQLHPSFFEKLLALNPSLTKTQLHICAMVRLNLSSKDIARLLNLSISTVETTRHHIRKKLELENADSLGNYLITI